MSGGSGTDAVDYSLASAGAVRASLLDQTTNTGLAAGDSYVSIETLLGTDFADTLFGDDLLNRLEGRAGNDRLYGNDGSDVLSGGVGQDALNGGGGTDTADYSSATAGLGADLAHPGANTGQAAGDTYISIENLTGSAFADILRGDAGNNVQRGGSGDDTLDGGRGGDVLDGGVGIDTVQYASAAAGVAVDLRDLQSANTGDAAGDSYRESRTSSVRASTMYSVATTVQTGSMAARPATTG